MMSRASGTRALPHRILWWATVFLAGLLSARPLAPQSLLNENGESLTVYLMTMGQGDAVWEKFGHNAIGIRDAATGSDVVYNWGTFSFNQPGFLVRFLRADTQYWLMPNDANATVAAYASWNRSVWIQELDLSPAQRLEVRRFVEWNAREENKFYRYDYFLDNCSTRVRDVIDRVVGGALRREMEPIVTDASFRDHSLRLTKDGLAVSVGIDLVLGRPADRPITAWEEMFIPMMLRDRIRGFTVRDDRGALRPLVRNEREVFTAVRPTEGTTPPNRAPFALIVGALGALVIVLLVRRAGGGLSWARTMAVSLAGAWSVVVGLLGTVLVFAWAATNHLFMYRNLNLLHFEPLWLLLAVAIGVAARRRRRDPTRTHTLVWAMALAGGALSAVGFVAWAIPAARQETGAAMALATPLNLAVAWAVVRLFPARRPRR